MSDHEAKTEPAGGASVLTDGLGGISGLVTRLRSPGRPSLEDARKAAAEIERLQNLLFSLGAMHDHPCFCCGYNGPGYYQESTHSCAKRHHKLLRQDPMDWDER